MITRAEEVEKHFVEKINRNELKPGDMLPSVKSIKEILGVGHVTAAHALQNLSKNGYIKTVRGHGSFVCEQTNIHTSAGIITYAFGHGMHPELTSFYMRIYQAAKETANASNYDLDFSPIDLTTPAEYRLCGADGASAIIFDTDHVLQQCDLSSLQSKNIPLIYCGIGSNLFDLNSAMPDNYAGARLATKHLISKGHKSIIFVNTFENATDYRCIDRQHGWEDTMRLANLNPAKVLKWHHIEYSEPVISILKKIKNKESDAPTALLVVNDCMAAEIVGAATQLGLSVPEDLSIIGFENHRHLNIQVSTIACSETDIGREAILLAEKILNHPKCQPIHIRIPMHLIERETVKSIY